MKWAAFTVVLFIGLMAKTSAHTAGIRQLDQVCASFSLMSLLGSTGVPVDNPSSIFETMLNCIGKHFGVSLVDKLVACAEIEVMGVDRLTGALGVSCRDGGLDRRILRCLKLDELPPPNSTANLQECITLPFTSGRSFDED